MDDSCCISDHALCVFLLATSMVHEIGHSAHHHLIGDNNKGFQDASLLAEAGFELESRIFGARPDINLRKLGQSSWSSWQTGDTVSFSELREKRRKISLICPTSVFLVLDRSFITRLLEDDTWRTWQSSTLEKSADMDRLCRDQSKLLQDDLQSPMETDFMLKLSSDGWWSGDEYADLGALALVLEVVASACRSQHAADVSIAGGVNENLFVPQSISDFLSGGASCAKVVYPLSANPGMVLRGDLVTDSSVSFKKNDNKRARDDSSDDESESSAVKKTKPTRPVAQAKSRRHRPWVSRRSITTRVFHCAGRGASVSHGNVTKA